MSQPSEEKRASSIRRMRALRLHFLAYFALMIALIAVNFALTPGNPWFVWPMVGWGGALAIHVAYAMGLFGGKA